MDKKILIGIILLTVMVGFLLFKGNIIGNVVGNPGDFITIPFSEISGQTRFYEVDGIKFFAVKSSDGDIKTAFDACDVCYNSKKGYRQEGDVMICNNCGNRYPISGLGTENLRGGGCWPGYLPSKIEGDDLRIKVSDLEKGRYKFR